MKASLQRAFVLAALVAVGSCTADDDGATDSGRYQSYLEQCHGYCESTVAQDCSAVATVEECVEGMVCDIYDSNAPPACKGALAVYHDCLLRQPDLCTATDACQAEANAAWDTCGAALD